MKTLQFTAESTSVLKVTKDNDLEDPNHFSIQLSNENFPGRLANSFSSVPVRIDVRRIFTFWGEGPPKNQSHAGGDVATLEWPDNYLHG